MRSLFLHVIKLIWAFQSKPENSDVFVDPMLERPPKELDFFRDGEKHVELCLDVGHSS